MRILMISSDKKIFEEGSAARVRTEEYSKLVDRLSVLVVDKKSLFGTRCIFAGPRLDLWRVGFVSAFLFRSNIAFNVITSQDPFELGLVASRLAKRFGAGLHMQIHTDLFSQNFAKGSLLNRFRLVIAKRTLPRANHVRVVSERIKSSVVALMPELAQQISVLPIWSDLWLLSSAEPKFDLKKKHPQFQKIVLTVSRLSGEKNIELGIRALALVAQKEPGVGLVVVGDGPCRPRLEKFATSVAPNLVVFAGWQNDTVSYYKGADLFLQTSLYEGYGLSAVEASACGLPLVSTDVGVARELGAAICELKPESCSSAVVQSLRNPTRSSSRLSQITKDEYLEQIKAGWAASAK